MKRLLAVFAPIALLIPALSFFGIGDVFPIVGFDNPGRVSTLSRKTFMSREWQTTLERSFSKTFFLRGLLYRTRCQAMEFLNLGLSHESELQSMGQFADGSLLAFPYMWYYHNPLSSVSRETLDAALRPISELNKILAANDVHMVFVMATDKYQFSKQPVAGLAGKIFKRQRDEFQSEYGRLLSEYGIESFDTYSFLTNEAPKYAAPMFPYAGTHWNAQASSLVVDELLSRLNQKAAKPYAINKFAGVEETSDPVPRFQDNDLGRLLNLLYNPYLRKNKSYLPRFSDKNFVPNKGSVIVFGDSFSWEIACSIKMSGDFASDKVLFCDKRVPTVGELDAVLPDLRIVVFVYQTPNMLNLDSTSVGKKAVQFCGILTRSFPLRQCASEDGGGKCKTIKLGKRLPLNASHAKNLAFFPCGLSQPEQRWTWTSGETARMRFKTKAESNMLAFDMDCTFYKDSQRVIVEANGTEVLNEVCSGDHLHFEFENPGVGKMTDLVFRFPDAAYPASDGLSDDTRILAVRMKSVTITPLVAEPR